MRNKDSHDISALYEQVNRGKSKLVSEQMPPYGMGSEPLGGDALSKVDTGSKPTPSGSVTYNPANWLRNPIWGMKKDAKTGEKLPNFTHEQSVMIAKKVGEFAVKMIQDSPNQIYPGNAEEFAKALRDDVIMSFTSKGRPIFNGTNAYWVARDSILMLTDAKIITQLTLKGKASVKGGVKITDPGAAIDELFADQ